MPECQAFGCSNHDSRNKISYFTIPDPLKTPTLTKQWIHNLRNAKLDAKTFEYSKSKVVCEVHFTPESFKRNLVKESLGYLPLRKFLNPDAIPTVFSFVKQDTSSSLVKSRRAERIQARESEEWRLQVLKDAEAEAHTSCDVSYGGTPDVEEIVGDTSDTVSCPSTPVTPRPANTKDKVTKSNRKRQKWSSTIQSTPSLDEATQVTPSDILGSPICSICEGHQTTNLPLHEQLQQVVSDHRYVQKETVTVETENTEVIDSVGLKAVGVESLGVDSVECDVTCMEMDEDGCMESNDEEMSPRKAERHDPTWKPSDESDESDVSDDMSESESDICIDVVQQPKYLVFKEQLHKLMRQIKCNQCGHSVDIENSASKSVGTYLKVTLVCVSGHNIYSWSSQPLINKMPSGNLLIAASSLYAGCSFTSIERFCTYLNLSFIGSTTFYKIQRNVLLPVISSFYHIHIDELLTSLSHADPLILCGDGRCDTPGHSAKYCTYTLMDTKTGKIVAHEVLSVTETGSSNAMEAEGLDRCLSNLLNRGIQIKMVVTDRHPQTRTVMKKYFASHGILHQFDVWHLCKSLRKKLLALGNKKGNAHLLPWIKALINHLWWCARECRGDADLLREMWLSIKHHIIDVHTFTGKLFVKCGHKELSIDDARKRKWFDADDKCYKEVVKAISDTRFLNDVARVSHFCHIGSLEVYHSMMLKYTPKRLEYNHQQMVARTKLAVIDNNYNTGRAQKADASGQKFRPAFPKATKEWTVKKVYEPKAYEYVQDILVQTVQHKLEHRPGLPAPPPSNIASAPYPGLSTLVAQYKSRFAHDVND